MPVDLPNLLLGLLAAAIPLAGLAWQLQRRASLAEREIALLGERLATAQLAQDGLNAQLETSREAYQQLGERHARFAGEVAALRREAELMGRSGNGRPRRRHVGPASARAGKRNCVAWLPNGCAGCGTARAAGKPPAAPDRPAVGPRRVAGTVRRTGGKIFDEREQRFAETSQQRLGQMLDPLKERIQAFEKRVEESYQQEARERFSLSKELERLQQLNLRLGEEATNLTRALKGQKTQGNWGELVLERVLEHAGLEKGREYETQVSLKGAEGERFQPDVLIRLPGDKQVVVDAKVSLTAYQQYIAADDDLLRQQALKQHVTSLRNHVKGLSGKDYRRLEGLHSLDFVLLFMPIEAAFSTALQAEPNLFQDAFAQNIVIVSPTTLLATLRVIDSLWRQERQNQNAREIAERAGSLYDKFVLFVQDLDEVGSRLQQLDKAYAAARNKLTEGRGNLISRSEQLKLLGARASKSLPTDWLDRALVAPVEEAGEE